MSETAAVDIDGNDADGGGEGLSQRARQGRRTRRAILDAAAHVFSRDGFRAGSLASISAAVGVSQQALLHHFSSKANVLLAVLRRRDEEDFNVAAAAAHRDLFERALEVVVRNETQRDEVRFFGVLVGEALTDDHIATPYFRDRYDQIRRRSAHMLEQAQRRGEVRPDVDVQDVAALLAAASDGLQIQWLLDPERTMTKPFRLLVTALAEAVYTEGHRPSDRAASAPQSTPAEEAESPRTSNRRTGEPHDSA